MIGLPPDGDAHSRNVPEHRDHEQRQVDREERLPVRRLQVDHAALEGPRRVPVAVLDALEGISFEDQLEPFLRPLTHHRRRLTLVHPDVLQDHLDGSGCNQAAAMWVWVYDSSSTENRFSFYRTCVLS